MKKRVPLLICILSVILAAIIAFFAAYAVTTDNYKAKIASYAGNNTAGTSGNSSIDVSSKFSTIVSLIKTYSYYEVTEEDLCYSLIEGFAYFKKDYYSCYYSEEDYQTLNEENSGDTQGIGVTVIEDKDNSCIKIVSVVKDSPAYKAGIQSGDRIVKIVDSDGTLLDVTSMSYDAAVKKVQGKSGTTAKFTIARGDDMSELIDFEIVREPFTSESVMYHVSDTLKYGKKVGVVKLISFDLTTPGQFKEAMNSLIADGCEYFVFDVRYNPGGDLNSITAVLSYMLNEGDKIIITRDREGNETIGYANAVTYSATSAYYGCSVAKEEIGMYRDYVLGKSAVLVNGSTASAAELFTIVLKDYEISEIVGVKTYGKGSMQSVLNLAYFGYTGGLKLTTKKYFPPISEGYDGIGITPDVEVELDEKLKNKNIYDISDAEDNQFQAAVSAIH